MRALLLLLLAAPAAALDIEREEYRIIGWDTACAVAVERTGLPVLGQAIYGEPVSTRVGVISIAPGKTESVTQWSLEADGPNTWDEERVLALRRELRRSGYARAGYPERVRSEEPVDAPGVRSVILSTGTLRARLAEWPGPEWRWAGAHYNPLSTCALLVFEKRAARERYKFQLARIDNPRVRADRALAHAANARLLYARGDLDGALAESDIAAALAPELAEVRYHHAANLALTGRIDEAMAELTVAVKKHRRWAERAAKDEDFDSLRSRQDFQELLR